MAAEQDINALIQRLNALDDVVVAESFDDEDGAEVVDLRESAADAPVIKLVNSLIGQGGRARAPPTSTSSPFEGELASATASTACSARPRRVPRRLEAGVISRIKIMADLDIAERAAPGRPHPR